MRRSISDHQSDLKSLNRTIKEEPCWSARNHLNDIGWVKWPVTTPGLLGPNVFNLHPKFQGHDFRFPDSRIVRYGQALPPLWFVNRVVINSTDFDSDYSPPRPWFVQSQILNSETLNLPLEWELLIRWAKIIYIPRFWLLFNIGFANYDMQLQPFTYVCRSWK